jgi:hypothetical protein
MVGHAGAAGTKAEEMRLNEAEGRLSNHVHAPRNQQYTVGWNLNRRQKVQNYLEVLGLFRLFWDFFETFLRLFWDFFEIFWEPVAAKFGKNCFLYFC